jgi:spermidine synthase
MSRKKNASGALPGATISEFDGVRYLHLGDTPWVQGAMRLRKHRALELEYIRRMMAWLLLVEPDTLADLQVVQLGLGAAALTRYCHSELHLQTTAVELNPQVIAVCRQWFRLPADDERLQVINADAGAWVAADSQRASADVLQVDLYDHQAAAPVLDDEDFYGHCHAALRPGGVLAVNLFGRQASFTRSARRIEAAFAAEGGKVVMLSPTDEGNSIVLALKGRALPDAVELERRARLVEARTALQASRWCHLIKPLPVPRVRSAAGKTGQAAQPSTPESELAAS